MSQLQREVEQLKAHLKKLDECISAIADSFIEVAPDSEGNLNALCNKRDLDALFEAQCLLPEQCLNEFHARAIIGFKQHVN